MFCGVKRASDQNLRSALSPSKKTSAIGSDNLARPMIAKRHQVDAGNATVSDLQIFICSTTRLRGFKNPPALDEAEPRVRKAQEESNASSASAMLFSAITTTAGTLIAVLLGGFIAFYTAKSIKEPLDQLIDVAHRIGESGDLDQTIDIRRKDEVGALAKTSTR
jgi:HAMP domain-containing protein